MNFNAGNANKPRIFFGLNMENVLVFDFESAAIEPRPKYPPKPVGIAVYGPATPAQYFAFGHPIENNCNEEYARVATADLISSAERIIAHNAPFDCAILEEHWGIEVPWNKVEDTMVMAFLDNPFGELALKPLAVQKLGLPPEERDAVRDWLITHGIVRANIKEWGAHICKAPGKLVGAYAIGDVERTYQLWKYYRERLST